MTAYTIGDFATDFERFRKEKGDPDQSKAERQVERESEDIRLIDQAIDNVRGVGLQLTEVDPACLKPETLPKMFETLTVLETLRGREEAELLTEKVKAGAEKLGLRRE